MSEAAGSQGGVRGLSRYGRWSKRAGSEDSQGQMCREYEDIHTGGPVDAGQKASGPTFAVRSSFSGANVVFRRMGEMIEERKIAKNKRTSEKMGRRNL